MNIPKILPICCIVFLLICYCDAAKEKRILVNDQVAMDERLRSMEAKLQQMTVTITQQQATINKLQSAPTVSGATYTRWGRTSCPDNNSELVYSGYMGGTHFNRYGGVADYICLVPDPVFSVATSPNDTFVQRIYGTEYDFSHLANDDLPCAVCRSKVHPTSLMFPGKVTCKDGWTKEYHGLLVSDRYVHTAATQFICLDSQYEAIPGSSANFDGKLIVPVIGKCGSLQCPPYEEDKYFTCVVCSK